MNDLPANLPPLPPDPICGNCDKPRSKHFDEDELYCNETTTGDVFTEEPSDYAVLEMFTDEQVKDAIRRWKITNGHIEAVRDEPATLKEAVDQWHAAKDQAAKDTVSRTCEKCGAKCVYYDGWNCLTEGCDEPTKDQPASGTEWTGKLWVTPGNKPAIAWIESDMVSPDGMAAAGFRLIVAKEVGEPATGTEARVCEDALAPFRNVARGIPDNWPGDCILRFDQREDGTIFLGYHGVNDASGGITINQWRELIDEAGTKGREGWQGIESAPRDREIILAADYSGRVTEGYWDEQKHGAYLGDCGGECHCPEYDDPPEPYWNTADGGFTEEHPPTHWMEKPLPPHPPEGSKP